MNDLLKCRQCQAEMPSKHLSRKYCDWRCKRAYQLAHGGKARSPAACRQCGKQFPRGPGQNAKSICSDECRRARLAEAVRNFHIRRPAMETIYRQRTREKVGADSSLRRFYLWNPTAPRACESCGETRVLTVAHKPAHARLGARRVKANCQWPLMTWVLCPTCHELLDRMNYTPTELGLTE